MRMRLILRGGLIRWDWLVVSVKLELIQIDAHQNLFIKPLKSLKQRPNP